MIGIYNRKSLRINRTFIQNIKDNAAPKTWEVYAELPKLQNCKIAIAHVSDDDWEELIKKYSCPDDVRVRVTVDGNFSDKPTPKKENGVYIFHLARQAGDLKKEEWTEILSSLADSKTVEDLIRGENPNRLRRFFVPEMTTVLSEWELRCSKFNHDWLKNFLSLSFSPFIELLFIEQPKKKDLKFMSEFLTKDFPAWESRRQEAQWIVRSFEDNMSPRVKESQDALEAVDKLQQEIAYKLPKLDLSAPIDKDDVAKLIPLRPQFCELKEAYKTLSKTLSNLP